MLGCFFNPTTTDNRHQVAEYILPLLSRAREISNGVFLKAAAASFAQAWRIVDVLMDVGRESVKKTQAEDVVYVFRLYTRQRLLKGPADTGCLNKTWMSISTKRSSR